MAELRGGLWHTTHPDRFKSILTCGAILPDPDVPDRHGSAGGPEHYPYARHLGAISLFDFVNFDPREHEKQYPGASWPYFVPHNIVWKCAVWIEIARERVAPKFISATDLLQRWRKEEAHGHKIMGGIEAAYIGALPVSAFKRAFFVTHENDIFHPLSIEVNAIK